MSNKIIPTDCMEEEKKSSTINYGKLNSTAFDKLDDYVKLNSAVFDKLDEDGSPSSLSDIYSLLILWCHDQAIVIENECTNTASSTSTTKSSFESPTNEKFDFIPDYQKGVVSFNYDSSRVSSCIEFCVDSETFFKYLLNKDGDTMKSSDPFFSNVLSFYFNRNTMRLATVLAIYNCIIEVLKGNMASSANASGYYGNAAGDICVLWLYGWGYYVYHGSYYKSSLLGDGERTKYLESILKKLKALVDPKAENQNADDDVKGLLEEVMELGCSNKIVARDSTTVERAMKLDSSFPKQQSTLNTFPSIQKIFVDQEAQLKLASKIGFYEMLDIAGKYLNRQRLYSNQKRNKIVENYILLGTILVVVGIAAGWYINVSNAIECSNGVDIEDTGSSCVSVEFGLMYQLGFFVFFVNLVLNVTGVIATFSGLIYGSFVCHVLIDSFMRRYKMLRKMKLSNPDTQDKGVNEEEQKYMKSTITTISSFLKRDCYERYIFIKTLLEQISQIWSGLLTGILIVSSIMMIFYYAIILVSGTINIAVLGILALIMVVFLTPTACCSYANSAMDMLVFKLKTSGPNDYLAIGGRDHFLEYATNTPCYWYIFGFAITPSWLAGFFGGAVSAVAVSVLVTKFSV